MWRNVQQYMSTGIYAPVEAIVWDVSDEDIVLANRVKTGTVIGKLSRKRGGGEMVEFDKIA